uniref:Major capsid protein N-terminal domain-containing protein n=1 Tax=viral metagenome TaxID=1070528 RepID=A0A6C0B5Q5_9ZZZZ
MGYGYLALAVKSEHDNYLVGNPQFTYFKAVYKRHTNFSSDFQEITFAHNTEDCWGKKIYLKVPKNGDLIHRCYLTIDVDITGSGPEREFGGLKDWDLATWGGGSGTYSYAPFAYNFIEYIDLYIGDQLIDRHYGEWLHICHDLFENSQKSLALAKMVELNTSTNDSAKRLYIPLKFWFNNDVGMSLPLLALQYSDVKFEIKFNKKTEVSKFSSGQAMESAITIKEVKILVENIYLDQDERRAFSSSKHEYLITQVQSSLNNTISNLDNLWGNTDAAATTKFQALRHKIDLRFTHPVKELFWTIQDKTGIKIPHINAAATAVAQTESFTNTGCFKYNYWNNYRIGQDQMNNCTLVLNNKELMDELPATFFRDVQQYQYHGSYGIEHISVFPRTRLNPLPNYQDYSKGSGVYSYSFSLYPENTQPSGSLNFSRLQGAQLKFGLNKGKEWAETTAGDVTPVQNKVVTIYAVNYNVLRIMSGLAGLVFTN